MTDLVLVTGGAGFIGSHLCDGLLRAGRRVRVLDDLSSGNLANLASQTELMVGDVTDRDTVRRALEGATACYHLAAIASVERGIRDWAGTHRVNLTGTVVLLEALRDRHIPFVYASSAAVYGNCADLPLLESATKRPMSAYGADKYGCELHAAVATFVHGIRTTGLRFFNVYGPRQDPSSPYSGVISIFCDRLTKGRPVEIFGDGGQTRDFIYVADVVDALLRALDVRAAEPAVFNVCSGEPISIKELAGVIAELAGTTAAARFRQARAGEIRHSSGSPVRAQAELGLPTPTPLRIGLSHTLRWLGHTPNPGQQPQLSQNLNQT